MFGLKLKLFSIVLDVIGMPFITMFSRSFKKSIIPTLLISYILIGCFEDFILR